MEMPQRLELDESRDLYGGNSFIFLPTFQGVPCLLSLCHSNSGIIIFCQSNFRHNQA
jgi:hypothetical protein